MTPPKDGYKFSPPPDLAASRPSSETRQSPTSSVASLPYRRSNSSLHSLFASTTTLPSSRPSSVSGTPPTPAVGAIFSSGSRANGLPSPGNAPVIGFDEPRSLLTRALVPHVGVLASSDTEEIVRQKGIRGGLLELLRPFGEKIPGKVTIRDSVGSSRSWEDYGIRFMGLKDGLGVPVYPARSSLEKSQQVNNGIPERLESNTYPIIRTGGDINTVEEAVGRHLLFTELQTSGPISPLYISQGDPQEPATSPFYSLYLRRLLSALPLSPHETFSHPVACIIAISSRSSSPIEELRQLYQSTNIGDFRLPQWVNNEYLRYYVLIHDEDHDDIAKSMALYEQMKRHFGLHCHLLRLRSTQCVPTDDDSTRLPTCEWMSASEELTEIQRREISDDIEDPTPYVFDSDVTAVRTFVRELVAQSVIPTMERLTSSWNEQILSRRKGISGRFISLSKRWTPFSSSSSSRSSLSSLQSSSSNGNYDSLQGFYRPDTPEALMRKLADYSFMLRDFKLAHSTYDLLRSDFQNDKAWKYHAGANEMTAIAALMLPSYSSSSKGRIEVVDQLLETASYSYLTRCTAPYNALRSLALGLELIKLRGSVGADDAARWAIRVIDSGFTGKIGQALFTERTSVCYQGRPGVGKLQSGSRRRKAAFWAILAAESWLNLDKTGQASRCLDEACVLYEINDEENAQPLPFEGMNTFVRDLRVAIAESRSGGLQAGGQSAATEEEAAVEEISENLDSEPNRHRKSLIGVVQAPFGALGDKPPLSPLDIEGKQLNFNSDGFA